MPSQCPRCGKILCTEQALLYHLNRKIKCLSIQCTTCLQSFSTKQDLKHHDCCTLPQEKRLRRKSSDDKEMLRRLSPSSYKVVKEIITLFDRKRSSTSN